MFFLATMDMTIASTSLVAITDDLGGFQRGSWVLTSYFLGYVGIYECKFIIKHNSKMFQT